MSITVKIARNTIIQIAGKILATIFGLVTVALMTRYLGKEGFGQYTTIIAYLQFFGILADLGLSLTTVRMISKPDIDEDKIVSNIFTLRFFTALFFLGIAPLVVFFFPYPLIIKLGVAITAFSFFCISLNGIFTAVFQKKLRMDKVVMGEVAGRIILLLFVVLAVYLKAGLLSIMSAVVLGSLVNLMIVYLFSKKYITLKFAYDWNIWKETWRKTWPIAISIFLNLIYLRVDTLILSLVKSQEEVGIYGAPYRILDILTTFPAMFMGLILPITAAAWIKKDFSHFKSFMQKAFDSMAIITLPLIAGSFILAEKIMVFIAGPDFAASGAVLQILIFALIGLFVGSTFSFNIIAVNKQRKMIWGYLATALISLAAYLVLIPKYSYFGAAWVTVFSETFIALLTFYIIYKTTKFLPSLKIFLKSLLASFIMVIFILILPQSWPVLILIFLAIFVYFLVLYLLKGFDKKFVMDTIKPKS